MLRFDKPQTHSTPRNYLARGEQTRLLTMVAALALVGVAIAQVNSPRGKQVLAALFGGEPQMAAKSKTSEQGGGNAAVELAEAPSWLSESQQQEIKDNTIFRAGESAAWFAILERLQQQAPAEAQAVHATYAQLARQPAAYRGRPVAISGHVARVERQTPAKNDLGIEAYWRVIFRPQGREVWPVAVYSLEQPEGIQDSDEPYYPGAAVGIFFKNLSYQSESGAGVMPVLLARRIDIDLPVGDSSNAQREIDGSDLPTMAAIGLAIAAAVVLLIVIRERSR